MSEPRMRLRSSITQEERDEMERKKQQKQEEKYNKPTIKFEGKTKYIRDFVDCAVLCDELITKADSMSDTFVLGFDLEWPFSFQTGPGKVALMQISPDLEICYLIQISDLKKIPKGLSILLAHPKVRLTGVNIKNDIKKIGRDLTGFDIEKIIENCIDTGAMANAILPFQQRWSMEKLVGYVLKMSMNKDKKVRMSKWHVSPLSDDQLMYAATDAYASLLLYKVLKLRQDKMDK